MKKIALQTKKKKKTLLFFHQSFSLFYTSKKKGTKIINATLVLKRSGLSLTKNSDREHLLFLV